MKKLFSLVLLLCLALTLPCAQAEALLTLDSPLLHTNGTLYVDEEYDGEYALERWFYVMGDTAAEVLQPYIDYLKTIPTLEYSGMVELATEDYYSVHHCFVPKDADYTCFSYTDVTDNACLDVYYAHGGNYSSYYACIFLSPDFALQALPTADEIFDKTASLDTSAFTVQDPLSFSEGRVMLYADEDNVYCHRKAYQITEGTGKEFAEAYAELIKTYDFMTYLECTAAPNGWVYHCFVPAEGQAFELFSTSSDDWSTDSLCLSICYHEDSSYVTLRFSNDFALSDLNQRYEPLPAEAPAFILTPKLRK